MKEHVIRLMPGEDILVVLVIIVINMILKAVMSQRVLEVFLKFVLEKGIPARA